MRNRRIRFCVLLNAEERQALARLAETTGGLSLGAMVRHLIRMEARRRQVWVVNTREEWSEEGEANPSRRGSR